MPADPAPPPSSPPLVSTSLSSSSSSSPSSSASTKLLIIALVIVFSILASISFHLLRHYLSRRRSSYTPPPSLPRPPSSHTQPPTSATSTPPPSDKSQRLSSFPLFPLSSPASVLPKSPDCAVCLSPFRPRDDLRLLPICRHAFHLHCIDMWLKSTPSCPLCRSPAAPEENSGESSGSCQVEIDLSYSFGSSVEHQADEEVETAVDRATTTVKEETGEDGEDGGIQGEVAEEDEGGGRGWLREYLDRVASSASTSFNSLTFSGRLSSHRFDSGSVESIAGGDCRSWDVEGVDWVEESGLAGIYRWFVGM